MEKAGMQVAYLELYCNMPALQLMQMHPPQKKKKTECYFPGRFCCRDHRPPLPLCIYPHGNPSAQIKTHHHQLHSSRSWISVLHHRSGGGTGTAPARACVCARERKKTFLGWCDIRGCLLRPSATGSVPTVSSGPEERRDKLLASASLSLRCNLCEPFPKNQLFGACSGMNMYERQTRQNFLGDARGKVQQKFAW